MSAVIEHILDLARWAPSGDNSQPWRFEIVAEDHVVVHGFDTRDHCVYDVNGQPSQMAIGALLETICLAATSHALRTEIKLRVGLPETRPTFDVQLFPDGLVSPHPLIPFIKARAVQRRAMSTRALTAHEKTELEYSVGNGYKVLWLDGWSRRLRAALLMFANSELRLTMPEAYAVHRKIIEWNAQFSEDRVPDQALGLDPLTLRLMHLIMKSWRRVDFFNTYLGGTLLPRIELDMIPGLACASHLVLLADSAPREVEDFVAAGRVMQRFWLTATRLGLWLQPEMTPIIFATYVRTNTRLSSDTGIFEKAYRLVARLERLIGKGEVPRAVFMARIGESSPPQARSLRLPLAHLITASGQSTRLPDPTLSLTALPNSNQV